MSEIEYHGCLRVEERKSENEREKERMLRSRHDRSGTARNVYFTIFDRRTKNYQCNITVSLVNRRVSKSQANKKRDKAKRRTGREEERVRTFEIKLIEILNYCTKLSGGGSS